MANSDAESIFSIKAERVINNVNVVPCGATVAPPPPLLSRTDQPRPPDYAHYGGESETPDGVKAREQA